MKRTDNCRFTAVLENKLTGVLSNVRSLNAGCTRVNKRFKFVPVHSEGRYPIGNFTHLPDYGIADGRNLGGKVGAYRPELTRKVAY